MSLADRDYMHGAPRIGRTSRLDTPPCDAIEGASEHLQQARRKPVEPRSTAPRVLVPLTRRLRQAGLLAAAVAAFTFAWAVGCGIVSASLHTDGGIFVPPATQGTPGGR